jgi:hypothetical protein
VGCRKKGCEDLVENGRWKRGEGAGCVSRGGRDGRETYGGRRVEVLLGVEMDGLVAASMESRFGIGVGVEASMVG